MNAASPWHKGNGMNWKAIWKRINTKKGIGAIILIIGAAAGGGAAALAPAPVLTELVCAITECEA